MEECNDVHDIYKSFSNKNRVQLLVCLSQAKSVTELLSLCTLSQSALSQHLKILKEADLVMCERDGKKQVYKVKNKEIVTVAKLLLALDN